MTDKPNLTSLELALLGLVGQEPRSGYELCRIFGTSPMMHYSASPGAIYPALKRLDRRDLLLGEVERSDSLRPVRTYRLSDRGRDSLVGWFSRPIERDDVIWRSDELMLRFAFMGQHVDLEATRRFLTELAEVVDRYVDELEAHHRSMPEDRPPHGRLALERGLDSYRSMAAWARRALGSFVTTANAGDTP